MNRKRIMYIGILLIVTVIVTITSFSYAFLTRIDEQHGKLNMVVGNLNYTIESNDLTNNSITLSQGESKEIELTIKALNEIDSKYELYTNSVENVEIGYLDEEGFDESTGTISKTGTKKVKIVLENNSDTSKTITFGVQGGFDYNDVVLLSGRVEIEEGKKLCKLVPGVAYEYDYTGNAQEFTAGCKGLYKVELWGAQGGNYASNVIGYGGYTSGNITLEKGTKLYVYIGEKGTSNNDYTNGKTTMSTYNGTFNGGGTVTTYGNGSIGGGATDIRLVNGNWNDFDSLKSRIMVAGGSGGTSNRQSTSDGTNIPYSVAYSAGGGLSGGTWTKSKTYYKNGGASGGTQTSGGIPYNNSSTQGTFGKGGNGVGNNAFGSSGAGGYYGGGGSSDAAAGAGGGSSFISGYNGCDAISESSTSSNIVHTGQPNHYSGNVFNNAVMIDGAGCDWSTGSATNCGANQPQPDGTMAVGHSGNGYARITYLGEVNVKFNAKGGTVSEYIRTLIYGDEIGTLPTPTYTGKYFLGWYLEDTYQTKVEANYVVTSDITLYAKWEDIVVLEDMLNTKPTATTENTTYNYNSNKLNITFNPTDTANVGARVIFNNIYNTAGTVHIKGTMTVQNSSATIKSKISMALGSTKRGSEKGTVIIKDNIDRGSTVSFDETFEIPANTYMTIQIGRHNTTDYSGSLIGTAEITEFYITNH